jgi:hypothetical protein
VKNTGHILYLVGIFAIGFAIGKITAANVPVYVTITAYIGAILMIVGHNLEIKVIKYGK